MDIVARSKPRVINQSLQFQCLPVVVVVRPGLFPVKNVSFISIHKSIVILLSQLSWLEFEVRKPITSLTVLTNFALSLCLVRLEGVSCTASSSNPLPVRSFNRGSGGWWCPFPGINQPTYYIFWLYLKRAFPTRIIWIQARNTENFQNSGQK